MTSQNWYNQIALAMTSRLPCTSVLRGVQDEVSAALRRSRLCSGSLKAFRMALRVFQGVGGSSWPCSQRRTIALLLLHELSSPSKTRGCRGPGRSCGWFRARTGVRGRNPNGPRNGEVERRIASAAPRSPPCARTVQTTTAWKCHTIAQGALANLDLRLRICLKK